MTTPHTPATQRLLNVEAYVRRLFAEKLPKNLLYHNADHTLHPLLGVAAIADKLAQLEGIAKDQQELVVAAAYMHDVGYTEQYAKNEPIGARIAGEILPAYGFMPHEIRIIQEAILCTDLSQQPKSHLERILRDADVDHVGREDFFEKGEALRKELSIISINEWLAMQSKFLEQHQFYTESARRLGEVKKQENISLTYQLISNGGV